MKRTKLVRKTPMARAGTPAAAKLLKRAFAKPKKVGLKKAKDKCWKWFSMFIRLRDADANGIVTCCTCPARKHWKEMDAGHYITRAKTSVFIDEGNCHGQCGGCNRFQGGKFFEHMQYIAKTKGRPELDRIHTLATQTCKRSEQDYLFWAGHYQQQVELQEREFPNKFR